MENRCNYLHGDQFSTNGLFQRSSDYAGAPWNS